MVAGPAEGREHTRRRSGRFGHQLLGILAGWEPAGRARLRWVHPCTSRRLPDLDVPPQPGRPPLHQAPGHQVHVRREDLARHRPRLLLLPRLVLGLIVRRAFHVHALEQENARLAETAPADGRVLGRVLTGAPEMMKVARMIERVASAQVSVLLLGASGTGKELLAQGLHDASPRRHGAFVPINCAAIPEALLESELFGHEKGAFTGAIKTTPGKIEQAQGGTLFLDEVGDISLALQVKLLRFLQERVIERIGGRTPIAVDTRIVCATHQDLDAMIGAGSFREDLYYRLAEIVIRIPALKERAGDPALLARHFLTRFAA